MKAVLRPSMWIHGEPTLGTRWRCMEATSCPLDVFGRSYLDLFGVFDA